MLYNNYYSMVGIFLNINYLMKFFVNKSVFYNQLGKNGNKSSLLDFLQRR